MALAGRKHSHMKYLALLFLLGACSTAPVHMRGPSGAIVQCGPYETFVAGHEAMATMLERGCIEDYSRQGFVRVP